MFATARKLVAGLGRSRRARVAVQAVVSVLLFYLLFQAVPRRELTRAWEHVGLQTLLAACGWFALAAIANIRRWQILLRSQGIEEGAVWLSEVFFIGLFCSLFLPTSAGGDAYRVYEVARRRGRQTVRVLLATMQDRLLGLGGMMAVGLVAACYYSDRLKGNLFAAVVMVFSGGLVAVAGLLYQGHVLRWVMAILARMPLASSWKSALTARLPGRLTSFLEPLREAPPINLWRTVRVVGLALATFLCAVAMYAAVCDALAVRCGFLALCLIVSLVGVVRMLPIALGGYGTGEGTFVFLAGLFGVASPEATLIALTILVVSVLMSALGGLVLLRRMFFRGQKVEASTAASSFPAVPVVQGGTERHAA